MLSFFRPRTITYRDPEVLAQALQKLAEAQNDLAARVRALETEQSRQHVTFQAALADVADGLAIVERINKRHAVRASREKGAPDAPDAPNPLFAMKRGR